MPNPAEDLARYTGQDYLYDDEEKLKRYRSRLSWAQKEQGDFRKNADIFLTYYRNKNKVFTRGGQKVVVPRAIKNVDAMFAALTSFDVWPAVTPRGLTTLDMAEVQQLALRQEWVDQEVLETAEHAIKESLVVGIGYVKVGYAYEEETIETEEGAEETYLVKDNVTVEHIPYDEIYFDPEAKKWEDIRWICQRYELPLEDVMKDDSFPDEAKAGLKRDATVKEDWRDSEHAEPSPDEERVVLYEMHDLMRGVVCTFSENHDQILKESPELFALRQTPKLRNPYVPYITRTDIGKVIGISDVQVMKPSIDEENVLRSSIATFVERMKPKLLADEGVMTEAGKKAMRSQEWGEVVELRGGTIAQGGVIPLQMPNLPQEAFLQDQKAAFDSDSSVAVNELSQGLLPEGRKTASAMNLLASATAVRQSEKRNHLDRFYRAIGDRMLYVMKLLYENERIVRMVGEREDVIWQFTAEDISFESNVGIDLEQKQILDTDAKRELAMAMWNIGGGDPEVDKTELKKLVFKLLGFPQEVIKALIKTPEEMQAEQMAAGQAQAAQAQAAEGIIPAPENIPGPLSGTGLVDMVNPGSPPVG